MLNVTCVLFQPCDGISAFSRVYDASWADKLYRGVARNYAGAFQFFCYCDAPYAFEEPIHRVQLDTTLPGYFKCLDPLRHRGRCLFMGLDTVITGDLSDLASFDGDLALIRDPNTGKGANGVVLHNKPVHHGYVEGIGKHQNEMNWLNAKPHEKIDDLYPGQVASYKKHIKHGERTEARIVYFHGHEKPHEIDHWVTAHWT